MSTIRFETSGGEAVYFESDFGHLMLFCARVGRKFDVLYDPCDPEKARVNSFVPLWMLPLCIVGIGLLFCCIGFYPV